MSPDARLLAAALLRRDPMNAFTRSGALEEIAALETALARLPKDDSERGIRGMIPVGLVREWLNGVQYRIDAVTINPAGHKAVIFDEIAAYLGRCQQQLEAL